MPIKNTPNFKRTLRISILAVIVSSVSIVYAFNRDDRNFEINKGLDIYYSLFRELNMFYVDSVDPDKLIKTSIDNMLESLDPYTTYIPESEMENFKFMTTGEYGGIGSLIGQRDEHVIISDPYEGMPAQLAGLKAGDILLEIDGKKLKGLKVSDVSDLLKGVPGTSFNLKVKRPGAKKSLTFDITRDKIQINPVPYYDILENNTGYLRLTNFTDKASEEVKKALIDLKSKGATSIILDLRSNPGGILDEAVNIVNLFTNKGETVVTTKGKVKQWDKSYVSKNTPVDLKIPLAVLVNRGSASASEIVSGALQDMDRAVIIGSRTFGKGLVQTTRNLNYNSKLKVTTAKYYIPSGRCIQALDYSHRNEDGSVGRIPDSLTTEFATKNGRTVKDGGGILPDIDIDYEKPGNITIALVKQFLIFDFATEYAYKNKSIASIDQFKVDDSVYESFKSYALNKDFTYSTETSDKLKSLLKTAKEEGYLELADDEFTALKSKLEVSPKTDFDRYKSEISNLLAEEIVKRYYYQKGEIKQGLKNDKALKKAIEVVNNSEVLSAILQGKEGKHLAKGIKLEK